MGLLDKLLGKKRIEEKMIKALDDADERKKEKSENLEEDEQLRRGREREEMVKYEKEQREREVEREEEKKEEEEEKEEEKEKEEEAGEDELISSLKKEAKEEEGEIDLAIMEEMEKMGNMSAGEILELGRTILQEMQGREGK